MAGRCRKAARRHLSRWDQLLCGCTSALRATYQSSVEGVALALYVTVIMIVARAVLLEAGVAVVQDVEEALGVLSDVGTLAWLCGLHAMVGAQRSLLRRKHIEANIVLMCLIGGCACSSTLTEAMDSDARAACAAAALVATIAALAASGASRWDTLVRCSTVLALCVGSWASATAPFRVVWALSTALWTEAPASTPLVVDAARAGLLGVLAHGVAKFGAQAV